MKTVRDILKKINEIERVRKLMDDNDFEKFSDNDGAIVYVFLGEYLDYLGGLKIVDKEADDD